MPKLSTKSGYSQKISESLRWIATQLDCLDDIMERLERIESYIIGQKGTGTVKTPKGAKTGTKRVKKC